MSGKGDVDAAPALQARIDAARIAKAARLAHHLRGTGHTAATAAHLSDAQWVAAAIAAGETRPGSVLTRRITTEMLAGSARHHALCPTCGMGDPEGLDLPRQRAGHDGPCSR